MTTHEQLACQGYFPEFRGLPAQSNWPACVARPTSPVTPWPEEAGPEANDARATWAMHEAARGALVAATRVLGEVGVPSIAVKGIVTAYWLYEDPTERSIGDVDLRIRPEDFRRAFEAQSPRCRSTTVTRCSRTLSSDAWA
jgi:hypothetical protein